MTPFAAARLDTTKSPSVRDDRYPALPAYHNGMANLTLLLTKRSGAQLREHTARVFVEAANGSRS